MQIKSILKKYLLYQYLLVIRHALCYYIHITDTHIQERKIWVCLKP